MVEQPTAPGWYDDPSGVHSHQAYWDGKKWTGQTRRPPQRMIPVLTFLAAGGLLWFLAVGLASHDEDYGNVTSGGVPLVAVLGLGGIAAVLVTNGASRWNPAITKRSLVILWMVVLGIAVVIWAVVFANSDNIIITK